MNYPSDVIVVGSGASGVHVAWPLVEAGLEVTMLDVGKEDTLYAQLIPERPFVEIRRTDPSQHRYFLGDRFEGVPLDTLGAGPQVTPPRQYVLRSVNEQSPTQAVGFAAVESLALGGLGCVWGAVSFPFLDSELSKAGLPAAEMQRHYETIAQRIGVSGGRDDLAVLRGALDALQPPLELDTNAELVLGQYQKKRTAFQRAGAFLGRSVLAVLTEPLHGRQPQEYHDMDFWSNAGESVYRPAMGVRELCRRPNFSYRRPYLVESFRETESGHVEVCTRSLTDGRTEAFAGHRLVLAAGALGTTRIVLRSLGLCDMTVPITCNAHTYVPCLNLRALGKPQRDRRHSLAQLTLIYDPTGDREHLVQAQLYSYRSLMLFRLLQELPLAQREALRIVRNLAHSMVIWVVQHEDYPKHHKYCQLRRGRGGAPDVLEIGYRQSADELRRQQLNERALMRFMRQLGCWPIKAVHPGHGSSAHYAGQFPLSTEDKPLTTDPRGLLRGTQSVYLADGCVLQYQPAKGLTFTLMANANRIGECVHQSLKN